MVKKREELNYLEIFRTLYPDFPKGKIQKHESPDFILKLSTKRSIGIEITRLFIFDPHPDHNQEIIPSLSPMEIYNKISEIIIRKEEKLRLYQKSRTDSLWLLIVADNLIETSATNFYNLIERHDFRSGFDKVFLLELNKEKLFELS